MALIRNCSPDDRVVPALGWKTVAADSVVEVPDDLVESFTCQEAVWALVTTTKKGSVPSVPSTPSEG